MKKTLLLLFLCIAFNYAKAQNDTLLFENFDVDPTADYLPFNSGNDTVWVDFDADGLPDANSRPPNWFWSAGGFSSVDSADACLFSSSWLAGFLFGNRNWLMTPPIQIVDANATLSWFSAPRQTPRYLDGYTVLVSTTDNIESSFTDTLFQAAQFISGTGNDFSSYVFSSGFVHGADGTYTEFDAASDSSRLIGVLRPFSASLASYAGQTIYIAFLHDSDDDNLISIDDILVKGTAPVGYQEITDAEKISVSPNPVKNKVAISYHLNRTSPVSIVVYDVTGKKVIDQSKGIQIAGNQNLFLDMSDLSSGIYQLLLNVGGKTLSTKLVKE